MSKYNRDEVDKKIRILTAEGKKRKQAVAIALSMTRKNLKKKAPKRPTRNQRSKR